MAHTEHLHKAPPDRFKTFLRAVLFALLFTGGMAGGFQYFSKRIFSYPPEQQTVQVAEEEDYLFLSVFYPLEGRLQMEERRVRKPETMLRKAHATVAEFLKGPAGVTDTVLPKNIKIMGVSFGIDGVLYVDLSGEFRMHFMGDAMVEYLTLRGLYESLMFNLMDISDVKVLVEGREIDTLGGHLSLRYPIGRNITKIVSRGVTPYEKGVAPYERGVYPNVRGVTPGVKGAAPLAPRMPSPLDEEVVTEELLERDVEGPHDER